MFDIGTGELLAIAVVALLVLGPDKLPRYAADAARFLKQIRTMANEARTEVTKELGPGLDGLDVDLRDLNPRALMRKHLLDPLDDEDDDDPPPRQQSQQSRERRLDAPATDSAYDPDTT